MPLGAGGALPLRGPLYTGTGFALEDAEAEAEAGGAEVAAAAELCADSLGGGPTLAEGTADAAGSGDDANQRSSVSYPKRTVIPRARRIPPVIQNARREGRSGGSLSGLEGDSEGSGGRGSGWARAAAGMRSEEH